MKIIRLHHLIILFFLLTTSVLALTPTPILMTNSYPANAISNKNAHVHQLNMRLARQKNLILSGLKSGTLSKQQAVTMMSNLKSTRIQEITYFKQNGNHEITPDQHNLLNQRLDKQSQVLGEPQNP